MERVLGYGSFLFGDGDQDQGPGELEDEGAQPGVKQGSDDHMDSEHEWAQGSREQGSGPLGDGDREWAQPGGEQGFGQVGDGDCEGAQLGGEEIEWDEIASCDEEMSEVEDGVDQEEESAQPGTGSFFGRT